MPRPKKAQNTPNSFIASAARVTSKRTRDVPQTQGVAAWQADAWRMLDTVGELEFYRLWKANALQRVSLYVAYEDDNGEQVRVNAGNASEYPGAETALAALEELFGGDAGQSEMMAMMGSHISIPGETWLLGLVDPPKDIDAPDQWRVLARDEISQEGSRWIIDRGDGHKETYEDGTREGTEPQALAIRIWNPHPRKQVEATSSVRSALPILRELEGLTMHVAATIDSRLAGAGVLFVPSELTFESPVPTDQGAAVDANTPQGTSPFMSALTDAMVASRTDRGDASAVVPIVARVPAQYLDKIKHLTFWSEFNSETRETRQETLQRLANALDVPAEVLTGMADVNHWTGWLLDENAIKLHIEPPANTITHGLTTRYLWPAMLGDAEEVDPQIRRWSFQPDTSALRQRPNRTAEAQSLHEKLVITDAALAREVGFEGSDLLTDPQNANELSRRLLLNVAGGVTTADLTAAALAALGVSLEPKPSEADAPTGDQPAALPAGPTGDQPAAQRGDVRQPPAQQQLALLLSSEATVLRAVERAWNKVGKRRGDRMAVDPHQLEDCLRGAWGWTDRAAAMCGVDPDRYRSTLDAFTRQLLVTGAEYDPMALAATLRDQVLTPALGDSGA